MSSRDEASTCIKVSDNDYEFRMDSNEFTPHNLYPPRETFLRTHCTFISLPFHQLTGDITDFALPEPYEQASFDMIMMTNAIEHMIPSRYGCLFDKLRKVSHPGSLVYIHAPTPQAQLASEQDNGENILPHHVLVGGMAMAGFELVEMVSDRHSSCGGTVFNLNRLPKSFDESACNQGGHAKYSHMIFQRVYDEKVLELKK